MKKYTWLADDFVLDLPHEGWREVFWHKAAWFDKEYGPKCGPEDKLKEMSVCWNEEAGLPSYTVSWDGADRGWMLMFTELVTNCTCCGRDMTDFELGVPQLWRNVRAVGQTDEDVKAILTEGKSFLCDTCKSNNSST